VLALIIGGMAAILDTTIVTIALHASERRQRWFSRCAFPAHRPTAPSTAFNCSTRRLPRSPRTTSRWR
jgi:hypothetical protein